MCKEDSETCDCWIDQAISLLDNVSPTERGLAYVPLKSSGKIGLESINERLTVLNVHYSEHSSCAELEQFVKSVLSRNIIPTVAPESRAAKRLLDRWAKQ
jgi:hypothetical protein